MAVPLVAIRVLDFWSYSAGPYCSGLLGDGHISVSAHTETFWQRLCQAIGPSGLGTDPRYHSRSKRSQPVKELVAIVEGAPLKLDAEGLMACAGAAAAGATALPTRCAEALADF
jgi:crotonobetainyl-CoA:carnitine CoA-transferase CaiB-like acyl-CoA transferase